MTFRSADAHLRVTDRDLRAASSPLLVERYERYRLNQGRELLRLLPRDGLREILARSSSEPEADPADLDRLARICASILPLPPYSIWLRDFHENRRHYDADGSGVAAADLPEGTGVTVDVRLFSYGPDEWVASLEIFPVPTGWRGRIRFHSTDHGTVTHTAEVFREELSTQIRERFLTTADATLKAFLRSTLP